MGDEMERELHEVNQYDDSSFPVGIYNVTKAGIVPAGRGYKDLHWHEELQFTFVTQGKAAIRVEGAEYRLEAGEGIFINRNLLHMTAELTDDGNYISINFPDRLLGFFPGSAMEQKTVFPYVGNEGLPAVVLQETVSWQKWILGELREIARLLFQKEVEDFEYAVSVKLVAVWQELIRSHKMNLRPSKGDMRRRIRVQNMLLFIREYYSQPIHLADIAAAANVSVGECCRCFRNMVGKSPTSYLLEYRIGKSMEILARDEKTVTETAYLVGFNDFSHFIQCFRKQTGVTPGEYKKKNVQKFI